MYVIEESITLFPSCLVVSFVYTECCDGLSIYCISHTDPLLNAPYILNVLAVVPHPRGSWVSGGIPTSGMLDIRFRD